MKVLRQNFKERTDVLSIKDSALSAKLASLFKGEIKVTGEEEEEMVEKSNLEIPVVNLSEANTEAVAADVTTTATTQLTGTFSKVTLIGQDGKETVIKSPTISEGAAIGLFDDLRKWIESQNEPKAADAVNSDYSEPTAQVDGTL